MNGLKVRALLDVNKEMYFHVRLRRWNFNFTPHEFCGVRRFLSQQFFHLTQDRILTLNALFGNNDRMQFFFTVLDRDYPIPEEVLDGTMSDFISFFKGAVPNANVLNVFINLRD